MKKYINVIAMSLLTCTLQAKTLTFATEATYPPFVSMNTNNQMVGFSADIVHAICKQMHQSCQLINAPWESLIPSLQMHQYDALFGGMAITKQRLKVVNFSVPFYKNDVVFIGAKNQKYNFSHLNHVTIGVQGGTQFQNYLQHIYGNQITIKTYASNMTALMDLEEGRVNMVFIDSPVAQLWLNKNNHKQHYAILNKVNNAAYFGLGNGIAINKDNTALLNKINNAITAIKHNGQYAKIKNKWFGG